MALLISHYCRSVVARLFLVGGTWVAKLDARALLTAVMTTESLQHSMQNFLLLTLLLIFAVALISMSSIFLEAHTVLSATSTRSTALSSVFSVPSLTLVLRDLVTLYIRRKHFFALDTSAFFILMRHCNKFSYSLTAV